MITFSLLFAGFACSKNNAPPSAAEDEAENPYGDDTPGGSMDESVRPPATVIEETSDEPAIALLKKVRATYLKMRTYSDVADQEVAISDLQSPEGSGQKTINTVHTDFSRPDCLRVEIHERNHYNSKIRTTVLWGCGKKTQRFDGGSVSAYGGMYGGYDEPPGEAAPDMKSWSAINNDAQAQNPVIALLLTKKLDDDSGGKTARSFFDSFRVIKMDGEEKVGKTRCIRLRFVMDPAAAKRLHSSNPFADVSDSLGIESRGQIWIDRKRLIVRKLRQVVIARDVGSMSVPGAGGIDVGGERTEMTYTYRPRVNPRLSYSDLAFGMAHLPDESAVTAKCLGDSTFKISAKSRETRRADAREKVDAAVKVYRECRSYADEGVMLLNPVDRRDRKQRRIAFRTSYRRSGELRIDHEYKNPEGDLFKHTCWSDGESCKTWFSETNAEQDMPDMNAVVDDLIGTHTIPARHMLGLLDASRFGQSELEKLVSPILLGTELIDGATCDKIQAKESRGFMVFLWIDANSHVIRRMETRDHGNGESIWVAISLKPRMNRRISDKALTFSVGK